MKLRLYVILLMLFSLSFLFSANSLKLEIIDDSTEEMGKKMIDDLKMAFDAEKDFILVSNTTASRLILKVQTAKNEQGFAYAVMLIAPGQQGLNYYINSMVASVKDKKIQNGVEKIVKYTIEQTKALRGAK